MPKARSVKSFCGGKISRGFLFPLASNEASFNPASASLEAKLSYRYAYASQIEELAPLYAGFFFSPPCKAGERCYAAHSCNPYRCVNIDVELMRHI